MSFGTIPSLDGSQAADIAILLIASIGIGLYLGLILVAVWDKNDKDASLD